MKAPVNQHRMQQQESTGKNSPRQRIISKARHHFFGFGIRSVTMDDLAKELGMSKKTIYTHFSSKEALLEAVILDKARDVEKDLDRITSNFSSDFLDSLRQLFQRMQHHLDEVKPPFLRDMQREAPEMFHVVEIRRRDLIHRYFGKLVEKGQDTGIIRKDISAGLIVEILLAAAQSIINPPKLAELGLEPKKCFSAIMTVIFEGVITERERPTL